MVGRALIVAILTFGQVWGWQGASGAAAGPADEPERWHRDAAQVRAAIASRTLSMSRARSDGNIMATEASPSGAKRTFLHAAGH